MGQHIDDTLRLTAEIRAAIREIVKDPSLNVADSEKARNLSEALKNALETVGTLKTLEGERTPLTSA